MINIEKDIQDCNLCEGLTKLKFNTISYGGNKEILFVGESPAKNGWLLTGRAFYNDKDKLLPTGKVLNELLKILNLTIDDITFTEACKCHIPDRKVLKSASLNCLPHLEKQIAMLNSKIIVPLGEHPTRILIDEKFKGFSEVVGKVYKKNIRGVEVLIIPIYHPSPINPKGYKNNVEIFEMIKTLLK